MLAPKSASAAASPAAPVQRQRRHPTPRLNPEMACATVFRVVARRYLGDLTANHAATCSADPAALHQMRIALTRLRPAILFFPPLPLSPLRPPPNTHSNLLISHLT